MGDSRVTYRVLMRRRGEWRPLGRHMPIFENDIKMDRQEGWEMPHIGLAVVRDVVNAVMNAWVV